MKLIPDSLQTQPVFLCVDDTMVSQFGTKFENVSKLFDHAAHNGSNYLNGHCFCTQVAENWGMVGVLMKNYYEILEVTPEASEEVIKAAYKALVKRMHPDNGKQCPFR